MSDEFTPVSARLSESAAGTVTWRQLWADAERVAGRTEGRWLCEEASGNEGPDFIAALDDPATERTVAHLDAMLARVAAGEPLQYVIGHWPFRSLDLLVDRRVLIPRPETEWVVEQALGLVAGRGGLLRCVDLGCGSGAIGLSLAVELPVDRTSVWLTDASDDALNVARANAAGIGRAAANVRFGLGSWWSALPDDLHGHIDLVVSNPPYVAESDEMDAVVRDWEPALALWAPADGLAHIHTIIDGAATWLAPSGWLVMEIGSSQGPAVAAAAGDAGLVSVEIRPDLAGRDRMLIARSPLNAGT